MSTPDRVSDERAKTLSLTIALHLALVAVLLVWCFLIVKPFMIILAWATILAVALKGLFEKVVAMVGGKRGMAATVFSLGAILLVAVPSYFVGGSLIGSVGSLRASMEAGTLQAPPPPEGLQNVPLVGERAHGAWVLFSDDLQQAMVQYEPQIRAFGGWLLGFFAGIGGAVLQTLVALIIASVLLTYAGPATRTLKAIGGRIEGNMDEDFVGLAAATIRSVASGVLGVAVIQAAFLGTGMFIAGIPAAGLFSIAVLVFAIAQLPPLLVMILPIVWAFGNMGVLWAVLFTIFAFVGSISDTPLKAVFLGRGVSVPTAVILFGAIGGMVSMGMMGLFLGAVVLGIGYRIFQLWLAGGELPEELVQESAGA